MRLWLSACPIFRLMSSLVIMVLRSRCASRIAKGLTVFPKSLRRGKHTPAITRPTFVVSPRNGLDEQQASLHRVGRLIRQVFFDCCFLKSTFDRVLVHRLLSSLLKKLKWHTSHPSQHSPRNQWRLCAGAHGRSTCTCMERDGDPGAGRPVHDADLYCGQGLRAQRDGLDHIHTPMVSAQEEQQTQGPPCPPPASPLRPSSVAATAPTPRTPVGDAWGEVPRKRLDSRVPTGVRWRTDRHRVEA